MLDSSARIDDFRFLSPLYLLRFRHRLSFEALAHELLRRYHLYYHEYAPMRSSRRAAPSVIQSPPQHASHFGATAHFGHCFTEPTTAARRFRDFAFEILSLFEN